MPGPKAPTPQPAQRRTDDEAARQQQRAREGEAAYASMFGDTSFDPAPGGITYREDAE